MGVQPKSRGGGPAVAAAGVVAGLLLAVDGGGAHDWLTWACFLLGACYAIAALAVRRWGSSERPEMRLGRIDRVSWLASAVHEYRTSWRRRPARPTRDRSVTRWLRPDQAGETRVLSRHRVGNALATVAAVVGLVLVFGQAGRHADEDHLRGTPPPTGPSAPSVPGPGQAAGHPETDDG